ncbi:MAG: hypothetical protein ACLTYJ_04305 [Merdibacter sp.]
MVRCLRSLQYHRFAVLPYFLRSAFHARELPKASRCRHHCNIRYRCG